MPATLAQRLAASQPWLDDVADAAQPAVARLVSGRPWLRDLLDGAWLGTPLHPVLTDVPLGCWTAAAVLDALAGLTGSESARRSAEAALAVGAAGAVGAAATGATDWRELRGEDRRLGTMHGLVNGAALVLTLASLLERRRDRLRLARALSAAGLVLASASAHVGGELVFTRGVGVEPAPPA